MWQLEKIAFFFNSNFSFCHNVFKSLQLQRHQHVSVWGKVLIFNLLFSGVQKKKRPEQNLTHYFVHCGKGKNYLTNGSMIYGSCKAVLFLRNVLVSPSLTGRHIGIFCISFFHQSTIIFSSFDIQSTLS